MKLRLFRKVQFFTDVEPGKIQVEFPLSFGWFGARAWRWLGISIICANLQRRAEMSRCVLGWRFVHGVGCYLLQFETREVGVCSACRDLQFHRCAYGRCAKGGGL